jgi:hypothetical protein
MLTYVGAIAGGGFDFEFKNSRAPLPALAAAGIAAGDPGEVDPPAPRPELPPPPKAHVAPSG